MIGMCRMCAEELFGKGRTLPIRYHCGHCGQEQRPGEKLCSNCGKPVYEMPRVHTFKANETPRRSQSDNATEPPSPSTAVRSRSRADRKFIVALIGIIVLAFVGNAALGGNTHDRSAHKESDRVAIRSNSGTHNG